MNKRQKKPKDGKEYFIIGGFTIFSGFGQLYCGDFKKCDVKVCRAIYIYIYMFFLMVKSC